MSDTLWEWGVRTAGIFHLVTVVMAHFTPIPANWEENLARLPDVHRRFAIAQNVFIGGVMVFAGLVSLFFAPSLVEGTGSARILCGGIALWWGGRLLVLPWLRVRAELGSGLLRAGFVLLQAECGAFALGYGWLAVRP